MPLEIKPAFTLFSVINLIGIAQAIFFSVLLFIPKENRSKAHLFLALFLLAYALVQLSEVLDESKYIIVLPNMSQVFPALIFAMGPLLFFYVRALTNKDFTLNWKHLLHFIPLLVLLLLLIPYFSLSTSEKLKIILQEYDQPDTDLIIPYIANIQIFIYLLLSMRAVRKYSDNVKDYFSNTDKVSLQWLIYLMIALSLIWAVWLLHTKYPMDLFKYTEAILFTAFIYALGFKGINQPDIFRKTSLPTQIEKIELKEEIPVTRKYEKSGIAFDKIEDSLSRLNKSMERDKIYRNSQLTLSELANVISVPAHHLSQLLNEKLNVNFYDYVNTYRIEEVKTELLNQKKDNLTILALALEAGFNSKASFNKAFKKYTGVSPSEYKLHNRKESKTHHEVVSSD